MLWTPQSAACGSIWSASAVLGYLAQAKHLRFAPCLHVAGVCETPQIQDAMVGIQVYHSCHNTVDAADCILIAMRGRKQERAP
jgi:hypothetical protein